MNVVADTNVVVSALLWRGIPHRILTAAEAGRLTLYASPTLPGRPQPKNSPTGT